MTENNSEQETSKRLPPKYVIGVGASAGGLTALETFFDNCPESADTAFVVIQHLSPDHKSIMNDLLARHTDLQIQVVEQAMPLLAQTVYLIPPGVVITISDGHFVVTEKMPHEFTLPIDIFFESLAKHFREKAIAVVLSGTGSDGSRGIKAVNANSGFVLVQAPDEAKFDGMPQSAIATGLVDEVLDVSQIPRRIMELTNESAQILGDDKSVAGIPLGVGKGGPYEGIFSQLARFSGISFAKYKPTTVERRIERRMQLLRIRQLQDYDDYLQQTPAELAVLTKDLLIPVTNFFRDGESFEYLKDMVIRPLVKRHSRPSDSIRVWVAGCSSGEEAYSLAILFNELFEEEDCWPELKIFATDVNKENIDNASMGVYPFAISGDISQTRLQKYFQKSGDEYVVNASIREPIVFARHNLLVDPPFTRLDLISCRNTLIYFKNDAQQNALGRFQYALKAGGTLFLGSSESLGNSAEGFDTRSGKHKVFVRNGRQVSMDLTDLSYAGQAPRSGKMRLGKNLGAGREANLNRPFEKALQKINSSFAPPSVLVNASGEVVHLFGHVQDFLILGEGAMTNQLASMLPKPLSPIASALTHQAHKGTDEAISDWTRVSVNGSAEKLVRIRMMTLGLQDVKPWVILSFEQKESSLSPDPLPVDVSEETLARVDMLEQELNATRESLQATIEELETANEELQATNEEMMASNEELQSSNEELQSVNEELNTVNSEYQEKVAVLNRINADLDSMGRAVGVATVFVDDELNITRFSPDATSLFKLRDSDIGRPLGDIVHDLAYSKLLADLKLTLDTQRMIEKEVANAYGNGHYLARLLPYTIPSTTMRGAVATFINISDFRFAENLQGVIDALPEHIAVLATDGTIKMVNRSWRTFACANGDPKEQTTGTGINYLDTLKNCGEDTLAKEAYFGIKSVLEGSSANFGLQYPCHSPEEQRWFLMSVAPVMTSEYAAVVSHFNISDWYEEPVS